MWLPRKPGRTTPPIQLIAALSPHDKPARKCQRLPAARSTGHISTGRRGGRPEFEHSAKHRKLLSTHRWPEIAVRSDTKRAAVTTGSCVSQLSSGCCCSARVLQEHQQVELLRPTGLSAVGVGGRGSFWKVLVGRSRQMGCRRADVSGMAGISQRKVPLMMAIAGASKKKNLGSPAPHSFNPPAAAPTGVFNPGGAPLPASAAKTGPLS